MNEVEFRERVLTDLATLKQQMKQLVGNGQPGRLAQQEGEIGRLWEKVRRQERAIYIAMGGVAVAVWTIRVVCGLLGFPLL